jgi:purine nucleosidase
MCLTFVEQRDFRVTSVLRPSPLINNQGLHEVNTSGRNIRVYTQLNVNLLLEDFYAKLYLFNQGKK